MNRLTSRTRVLLAFLTFSSASYAAEYFGPSPYLQASDTPAGFADDRTFIEDFEDGVADPRLSFALTGQIIPPGGLTDSVDADDGSIDGKGSGGRSFFRGIPQVVIDFATPYPQSAGLVWTDGAPNTQVRFEAFDRDGLSLGVHGPFTLGDSSNAGNTAEDRFFGVKHADGVRRIQISHSSGGIEIDHVQFSAAAPVETAIISALEDGDIGIVLPSPGAQLPTPDMQRLDLGAGRPHGLAFLSGTEALFADFDLPTLYRVPINGASAATPVALQHRSSANGSLAVSPFRRFALSIGQSASGEGEAVVLDFSVDPPIETPISGGLRVLPFVTAAIDFDPEGRAFVCHVNGVSVLSPPYTSIDFSLPFPATLQSPSMCRLSRDGGRLFVTRVLSESSPSINGVRTTSAPYSANSQFTVMPAPTDVQGLGPMAVSPDGQSLLVGQQFLFPPQLAGRRARAFVLRAPFDAATTYQEITLPAETSGLNCRSGATAQDCSGFEHIEVSDSGELAVLTGNSSSRDNSVAGGVPAVFIRHPFDSARRSAQPVVVSAGGVNDGRGTGGVRFQPVQVFRDGLE